MKNKLVIGLLIVSQVGGAMASGSTHGKIARTAHVTQLTADQREELALKKEIADYAIAEVALAKKNLENAINMAKILKLNLETIDFLNIKDGDHLKLKASDDAEKIVQELNLTHKLALKKSYRAQAAASNILAKHHQANRLRDADAKSAE